MQATGSSDNLDVDKILRLKQQSNTLTQFSAESHAQKARLLVKPLARQTVKLLAQQATATEAGAEDDHRILTQIGLLVSLVGRSSEPFCIDLPSKAVARLNRMRQDGRKLDDLKEYSLVKFIKLTKQADEFNAHNLPTEADVDEDLSINIDQIVQENIVLSAYADDLDKNEL